MLRYVVSAAAPLPWLEAKIFYEKYDVQVLQGYGLSETTNFLTMTPVGLSNDDYERLYFSGKQLPVGTTLLDYEVKVNKQGLVICKGSNVMEGYLNNKNVFSDVSAPVYFNTGDIGYIKHDSQIGKDFLYLTGREKAIAIRGGRKYMLTRIRRSSYTS